MTSTHVGRRGGNAIEFALTLPLFVLLFFGILEYGWLFFRQATIAEATREGCEQGAMVNPDASPAPAEIGRTSIRDRLKAKGYTYFDIVEPRVVGSPPPEGVYATSSSSSAGGAVRLVCNARVRHKALTRVMPTSLLPTQLSSHAEMRLQQQP